MSESTWTRFFDMSSGGFEKTNYAIIWIEAPEEQATRVFENVFDIHPFNITCACCGSDFSVDVYYDTEAMREGDAIISKEDVVNIESGFSLGAIEVYKGGTK